MPVAPYRCASRALEYAEQDHLADALSEAAHRRGSHEQHDRDQQVASASDPHRDPSAHRNHHADCRQVTGDNPANPVDANAEACLHVRQRDVDDRAVQDGQNRAEQHRRGDQPLVRLRVLGRYFDRGSSRGREDWFGVHNS